MGMLHITCKKATLLIIKKEEKKLSWLERWQLRGHLTICSLCRKFEIQSAFISRIAKEYLQSVHLLGEEKKEKIQERFEADRAGS